MIKVLIVEDDKLVRKGLIAKMPWQNHQMEVVGEAKNGEKAVAFIAENQVDLIFTDLAMPVMSGIELMRTVRKHYPDIFTVVLSLHQDFEYVQEALRMGAIDYIAKVELDNDRFDEILSRIHKRILSEQNKSDRENHLINIDHGWIVMATNEQCMDEFQVKKGEDYQRHQLGVNGVDLFLPANETVSKQLENSLQRLALTKEGICVISLTGLSGRNLTEVQQLVLAYREGDFFYDYDPNEPMLFKTIHTLDVTRDDQDDQLFTEVKEQLLALHWMYDDTNYNKIVTTIKQMRLPSSTLMNLIYLVVNEWNRIYATITSNRIALPELFANWIEVESWLDDMRAKINQANREEHLSTEVKQCIIKAISYIHEELNTEIQATEMAKRINMSRSYFSQCFKELVGMTFNEYVRKVRMEKAKQYLVCTDKKVHWIAEHTGYTDVKYFSKLFRASTGLLPSEYRKQTRRGTG